MCDDLKNDFVDDVSVITTYYVGASSDRRVKRSFLEYEPILYVENEPMWELIDAIAITEQVILGIWRTLTKIPSKDDEIHCIGRDVADWYACSLVKSETFNWIWKL